MVKDKNKLPEELKMMAREGGHARIELSDETTHQAFFVGDYELNEPEWSGDTGTFWTSVEFSEPKDPGGLDEDQYPTELGEISAEITDDGWKEIELMTSV